MKNRLLYTTLILLMAHTATVKAQVMGVNTENPTRAVDVNGKVRITSAEEKTLGNISHLIVADADGNLEKIAKPVEPVADQSVDIFSRVVILGNTNTPSNVQLADLQVDGFVFGINGTGVPTVRRTSGSSQFTYGVKILDRRSGFGGSTAQNNNPLQYGHSAGSGDGRVYFRNFTRTIGTTDVTLIDAIANSSTSASNTFQITTSPSSTALTKNIARTNTLRRRDNIRVHLVHPNYENYFYKITYMRMQNGGTPLGLQANGYSAPIPDNGSWEGAGSIAAPDIWVITVERYNNLFNND
ncbi:hypothetical protein [Macellibacteroides fermentans]|uniref:hypothetical protein n=1 Tax=Macellibacteroides fermentans TaxID=879969 RepID=UPI00406CC905